MKASGTSPFGGVPPGWSLTTVKAVTTKVGSGATPLGGASVYLPTRQRFALIRSQHVFDRWFDETDLAFIDDEAAARLASAEVRPGDVLLNITGDGVTFSRACLAPSRVLPACVNQHVAIVRVDPGRCRPGYMHAYLTAPAIKPYIASFNTGASRRAVTKAAIESFVIPLPPLRVQDRIADILSAYDDLIENNTKRIKILEEMARSLYREWFMNFRFPGHEKVKMVNSPLGKVPEGWEVVELGALVDDFRDSVDPAELAPDTPYFGLEHLPRRSLALGDWGRAADVQSTKLRLKTMDILFGKIRPYFHKVGPSPVDGVCSSDTIVLRVRAAEHYAVVLSATSSDEFVSHATQTSQGTKMPRANWDVLRRYAIPLPPPALLRRFNGVVTDNVTLIHALLFKNRNLSATRDLLLPRLISGEIVVGSNA